MSFIDFILNLAGLLLWLNWRAEKADPVGKRRPATLIGTLRRADARSRHWQIPSLIAALIGLRALFYWQVGSTARWSASLDLGAKVLFFPIPGDTWASLGLMLLFSLLSFGLTLAFWYLSLLLLSLLDGPEPFRTFVRQQLGRPDGWSRGHKLLLPFLAGAPLWWLASWPLAWFQLIPAPAAEWRRIGEALVVGAGSYLAWQYAAIGLLGLFLLNSYIYFGRHPFWNFVNAGALVLLKPLKKVPLRLGRVDLAPVAGILAVLLAAEGIGRLLVFLCRKLSV